MNYIPTLYIPVEDSTQTQFENLVWFGLI